MTASEELAPPRIHLSVAAKSDIGLVRDQNEDSFLIADLTRGERAIEGGVSRIDVTDKGVLLVVSDGMGGERAGEVASALVVEGLARVLEQAPIDARPDLQLKNAVARANSEVVEGARAAHRKGMGATLTAVHVKGATAYVAEVGDSRAYLIRLGVIRQLTRDQNVAQVLTDAGALGPEEASRSPLKHVLAQAMGQSHPLQVALGKLNLRDRDCLLLCSDGLTASLTEEDLRATVLLSSSLDEACRRLIALANERGGVDNATIVLAGVGGDLPAAVATERVSTTYEILETFAPPAGPSTAGKKLVPAAVKMTP
jgi:PPM family protein phosphatase